jgi:3',5'-cyclic-AMP phosphodiesterase
MKIAHISDLHLRHHLPGTAEIPERLSRKMPDYFRIALRQIQVESPDLLVVSGDLLDYPTDKLHDPSALAQGEKDLRLIAELLQTMTCPIALVHGNHDHAGLVQRVFAHVPNDQVCAGYRVLSFADEEGENNVPQRPRPEWNRFLRALEEPDSLPQIHVQHYVVWPERNEGYPHTHGRAVEMRDRIVASGQVRLVLSGHYHRGVSPVNEKGVYFATVRAFGEEPHPFWIYTLEGEDVHYREVLLVL